MLKKYGIFTSVLPVIATYSLVIVLCPSNSYPQPQSKAENKPATQDKRGTQESPLIIQGDITTKAAEKSESDRKQEEVKIEIEGSLAKYTGVAAGATGLLVAVTAVLAWFTYRLWDSTHKLVEGAEDTARRQLRAYVLVPRVDIVDRSPTPRFTEKWVEVSIKNFGHIPATSISYWLAICAEEYPLRTALERGTVTQTIGVLAPGGDPFIAEITTPLINNNIASISDHGMALYVYGEVRYFDGFHPDRVTPFRYMKRSGEDWSRNGKLEMCQEGNDPN